MKEQKTISVLFSGPLPPPLGGMTTYCQDYLRSNLSSEFNIIFCRSNLIKGTYEVKGLCSFVLRCLNSVVMMIVWVWRLICKHPDIAHVHTNSYVGFYKRGILTILARMFGTRTILHVHGAWFDKFYDKSSWFMQRLIRYLLNANSVVVVLSEEWEDFFMDTIGVQSDRLVVIHNSVFLPNVNVTGPIEDSDRLTILFLSLFEKRKGIYELVDVIANRRQLLKKYRFVLAGPKNTEWDIVAKRINQLNLSDSVEMPGPLVEDAKDRAYRESDIYVLQSYAEGMPLGLLEAMSYGLVCITTPVGGIPQVVQDMHNGILIEPGNVDALENTLERLAADPALRDELGKRALETVKMDYNWEKRAEDIKKLYLDIVGASS